MENNESQPNLEGNQWIISMIKDDKGKMSSIFEINPRWNHSKTKDLLPFGQIVEQPSIKILKQII